MMMPGRMRVQTAILVAANLLLLVAATLIWIGGQREINAPTRLAARHPALPDLSVLTPPTQVEVDIARIRDNAVFHTHRTFYQPPPPMPVIATPDYEFAGSIGLPEGRRVAFVKRKSDKSNRTLHVGDDLDGWKVETIDAARVVIVRDTQRFELKSDSGTLGAGMVRAAVGTAVASPNNRTLTPGVQPSPLGAAPINVARTYQPPPPPH